MMWSDVLFLGRVFVQVSVHGVVVEVGVSMMVIGDVALRWVELYCRVVLGQSVVFYDLID